MYISWIYRVKIVYFSHKKCRVLFGRKGNKTAVSDKLVAYKY